MKKTVMLLCLLIASLVLLCSCGSSVSYDKTPFKRVDSIVTFGHYEQDNNTGNGKEEIEWYVLDYSDGVCTLISRYGLDTRPFHTENNKTAWPDCSLRSWLNDGFLNSAFNEAERKAITTTTLNNGTEQNGGQISADVYGVNADYTQDKVFLLSLAEYNKYLKADNRSECTPTQYAISRGASKITGAWWLRSVVCSFDEYKAYAYQMEFHKPLYNNFTGPSALVSSNDNFDNFIIRPVICLNLDADCFK